MINVTEARKGITIELLDYDHIKMARGSAQVRLKLRDRPKSDLKKRLDAVV
jgi:hypothetical protein